MLAGFYSVLLLLVVVILLSIEVSPFLTGFVEGSGARAARSVAHHSEGPSPPASGPRRSASCPPCASSRAAARQIRDCSTACMCQACATGSKKPASVLPPALEGQARRRRGIASERWKRTARQARQQRQQRPSFASASVHLKAIKRQRLGFCQLFVSVNSQYRPYRTISWVSWSCRSFSPVFRRCVHFVLQCVP